MPDQDRPRIKPALYKASDARYLNYEDLQAEARKDNVLWVNDSALFVPGYQVCRRRKRHRERRHLEAAFRPRHQHAVAVETGR